MSEFNDKVVPYNEVQGIASTNVPAYSNEDDEFVSFEGSYLYGIFTGFKWQCVEYARRWLLLRKSCIFSKFKTAASMWEDLKFVERVTDGKQFATTTYTNGSQYKPKADSFLIYPVTKWTPYGHIAVISDVHDNYICIAEQNYRFQYWPNNYARQIPLIYEDGHYYIKDEIDVYGWIEIDETDTLEPLEQSNIHLIQDKYRNSKPVGTLERCVQINNIPIKKNICFYQTDENLFVNISNMSNIIYRLYLETINYTINNDRILKFLEIPKDFWGLIRKSWSNERYLNMLDNFNLKFNGNRFQLSKSKYESPFDIFQSTIDQEKQADLMNVNFYFTSGFQLHRLLVRFWKRLNIKSIVHLLVENNSNEVYTGLYMKRVLTEAGIESKLCVLPYDLYWNSSLIVDKDQQTVKIVWKLWNWEKMFNDYNDVFKFNKDRHDYNPCLYDIIFHQEITIIEPIWKSITNQKSFLSILHSFYPNLFETNEESHDVSSFNCSIDENDYVDEYPDEMFVDEPSLSEVSKETVVSWIINGVFSGFSLCEKDPRIADDNDPVATVCGILR